MKRNEIIVYEHKKGVRAVKYNKKPQTTIEPPKPRNPVAKNANAAIGGGAAGAHKDKKKAAKQGDVKHKSKALDMAEATKKPNATTRHLRDYPVSDKDVAKPVKKPEKKKPEQGVAEMYGRKSSYYNPMDYERDQQRQMDYDKREFKRQELQHELGHEDDPNWQRQQRDRDRGPWYIKINGKILKVKGEPKVFDWKSGATKYGQAILKNKPELTGKIMLTKNGVDDVAEAGEEVGKITKVDPMTKKATIAKADGSTQEIDSTALKPTADGKMQMDAPDDDELKSGTPVVSTEGATGEEMMVPSSDSRSPIPGDNDHDEISKLLVHRLRRLAGL